LDTLNMTPDEVTRIVKIEVISIIPTRFSSRQSRMARSAKLYLLSGNSRNYVGSTTKLNLPPALRGV
jgi:hypothetical protein